MKARKFLLLLTDFGFLAYWLVTYLHLLPPEYLFKDYANPIISDWNWSFFPLDILASISGLAGTFLGRKRSGPWYGLSENLIRISLVLTFCAGFMALSFWTVRQDFDPTWWAANGFLAIWPWFFILRQVRWARGD